MEDKEIEKLLKESAEEVKVKDFSERWENIKGRIGLAQEAELKETTFETVFATSANTSASHNTARNKFIISVCAVFLLIAICLAIVLPLTLKNNDKIYFSFQELTPVIVEKNEFYDKIETSELEVVDFSKFETSKYTLFYSPDNEFVGGRVELFDEETEVFATVIFYNSSVKSSFDVGEAYKEYTTHGANIIYNSELSEDYYSVKAKAVKNNINYEFDCMAFNEEINDFFGKIFG